MILPYQAIVYRCAHDGLITPYCQRTEHIDGMTYGLGPAGYDVRVAQPVSMDPGDFFLASSMEKFSMPNDLLAQVCDKSTLARKGLFVQNTIIEPGWRGYLTLELTYHQPYTADPLVLRGGSPIAQIIFFKLTEPTALTYEGKYQDQQSGPVPPLFRRPSWDGVTPA